MAFRGWTLTAAYGPEFHDVTSRVILKSMTYRVGPKGQVVIPKALRDQLGIVPGDEVDFTLDNNAVRMEPVRTDLSLCGSLRGLGLTAMLELDHRVENER
jgi:AbrB family looped-hinge helix DNA binding protein